MNISKHRPTDEAIKNALLSGKTTLQVCKELKTHSQRIMQVKQKYGLECEVIHLGDKLGCKSFWLVGEVKTGGKRYVSQSKERFVMNMF